jgi:hypothetical protein
LFSGKTFTLFFAQNPTEADRIQNNAGGHAYEFKLAA